MTKPKFSEPCQKCGYCCSQELCYVAQISGETSTPCIFFEEHGCLFVLTEKQHNLPQLISDSLGIGEGCSCPDADTTEQEIYGFDHRALIKRALCATP